MILKRFDLFKEGKELPLLEEFYSLQGEGYNMGKAAYFIRLGGCDLACDWCDSKISWKANMHQLVGVETIIEKSKPHPAKAVVVTGGEPLTYNLTFLCQEFHKNGIQTFLETSGAYPLTGDWDWICLSPKKQKAPHPDIYKKAHELKVIIYDESDFEWAEENARQVSPDCKLYLQSEWSRYPQLVSPIVEYIKQNPKWNISIQAHKFMKIP